MPNAQRFASPKQILQRSLQRKLVRQCVYGAMLLLILALLLLVTACASRPMTPYVPPKIPSPPALPLPPNTIPLSERLSILLNELRQSLELGKPVLLNTIKAGPND